METNNRRFGYRGDPPGSSSVRLYSAGDVSPVAFALPGSARAYSLSDGAFTWRKHYTHQWQRGGSKRIANRRHLTALNNFSRAPLRPPPPQSKRPEDFAYAAPAVQLITNLPRITIAPMCVSRSFLSESLAQRKVVETVTGLSRRIL